MSYVKPHEVLAQMVAAGTAKAHLPGWDLVIRGFLAGGILSYATSLAITASIQSNVPLVGAVVFPVGLVMIVLLGLELVTGSFALVPLALLARRASVRDVLRHIGMVLLGNFLGAMCYAGLLYLTLKPGAGGASPLAAKLIALAQTKTTGYAAAGGAGMLAVFIKAVLCNWMVTLGVVMGMTSTSTLGKIAAIWMPIFMFFAQGFEHLVVNLFIIPMGMLCGAQVSVADWLVWNALPVTLGNIMGGFLFTGLALYLTYRIVPAQSASGQTSLPHEVSRDVGAAGAIQPDAVLAGAVRS